MDEDGGDPQAAVAQRGAAAAEHAQSLAALGALRLDCEAAARCGGPTPTSDATSISEAISEAISLLLEAISLYALSLGPFHPRLGYALSCLARAYALSDRSSGGVPGRGGDGTADGVAGGVADDASHPHHTHRLAVLQRLAHIGPASHGSAATLASRQLELTSRDGIPALAPRWPRCKPTSAASSASSSASGAASAPLSRASGRGGLSSPSRRSLPASARAAVIAWSEES